MSVMEAVAGVEFLYATLTGDSTLMAIVTGVFRDVAPDQAVPPFIVLNLQAGADVLTANKVRLMSSALYQVRALGPASMSTQLAAAAARIDDLLKRTNGTVTGGNIGYCYRESPVLRGLPPVQGVAWAAIGGMYRMGIQAM